MPTAEEIDDATRKKVLVELTAEIVAAYVGSNSVPSDQIGAIINQVHQALTALGTRTDVTTPEPPRPAVPVRRSVFDDHIICLEDGKRLKMLKRYLRARYGLSPAEYRAKWGLPPDYPMVAPNYAAQRSAFAKQIGLGRDGRRTKR
jgi:predicted transcriptional regulator